MSKKKELRDIGAGQGRCFINEVLNDEERAIHKKTRWAASEGILQGVNVWNGKIYVHVGSKSFMVESLECLDNMIKAQK